MVKRYLLDSLQSKFTVQAFATGVLGGFGHNPRFAIRQFDGELDFDPDIHEPSSFQMTVAAGSLELIDKVKEDERKQIQSVLMEQVLQPNRYPQIAFRSSSVAATRISGDWFRLQMRGEMRLCAAAKPVSIDSQLRISGHETRLSGEFALRMSDYQIKTVSAVGGLIKVKDELKFVFEMVAREQV